MTPRSIACVGFASITCAALRRWAGWHSRNNSRRVRVVTNIRDSIIRQQRAAAAPAAGGGPSPGGGGWQGLGLGFGGFRAGRRGGGQGQRGGRGDICGAVLRPRTSRANIRDTVSNSITSRAEGGGYKPRLSGPGKLLRAHNASALPTAPAAPPPPPPLGPPPAPPCPHGPPRPPPPPPAAGRKQPPGRPGRPGRPGARRPRPGRWLGARRPRGCGPAQPGGCGLRWAGGGAGCVQPRACRRLAGRAGGRGTCSSQRSLGSRRREEEGGGGMGAPVAEACAQLSARKYRTVESRSPLSVLDVLAWTRPLSSRNPLSRRATLCPAATRHTTSASGGGARRWSPPAS